MLVPTILSPIQTNTPFPTKEVLREELLEDDWGSLDFTPSFCRKSRMTKFDTQNFYPNTCLDVGWASSNLNLIPPKRKLSPNLTYGYNGKYLGCVQQSHEKSYFSSEKLFFQPLPLSRLPPLLSSGFTSSHSHASKQANILTNPLYKNLNSFLYYKLKPSTQELGYPMPLPQDQGA